MVMVAHCIRVLIVAALVAVWVATLGAISVEVEFVSGHGVDLPGWWR